MERTLGQMEILEEVDKQEVTAIETNSLLCSEEFRLLVLERDITFQFLVLDISKNTNSLLCSEVQKPGFYSQKVQAFSLRKAHYILVFGSWPFYSQKGTLHFWYFDIFILRKSQRGTLHFSFWFLTFLFLESLGLQVTFLFILFWKLPNNKYVNVTRLTTIY